MSVIVKNMELSESCAACRFLVCDDFEDTFECVALEKFMDDDELPEGRRDDCPLVELTRCKDCKLNGLCVLSHTELAGEGYCAWAYSKVKK